LSGGQTVRDLAGVKLEVEPADGDGFHGVTLAWSHSAVLKVLMAEAVMMAAPPP
jgi:hypothetical protein